MLQVTVELVPHGDESISSNIAQAEIWREPDEHSTGHVHSYSYRISTDQSGEWKTLTGTGVRHHYLHPVWELISKCLSKAGLYWIGDQPLVAHRSIAPSLRPSTPIEQLGWAGV